MQLPTVQELAGQLHLSANYLSDLLRTHTGLSARQHIQQQLVAYAKQLRSTSSLSVGVVAYCLGFEHSQYLITITAFSGSTPPCRRSTTA